VTWRLSAVGLGLFVGLAADAVAAESASCQESCGDDLPCLEQVALCLMEAGEHRAAAKLLKRARTLAPMAGRLVRMQSLAYLGAGNRHWAVKTLLIRTSEEPTDLETRSWAVWLLIQDGDLARARQLLAEAPVPRSDPLAGRLVLLETAIGQLEGQLERAKVQLHQISDAQALFAEDLSLLRQLRGKLLGDRCEPFSARIQASGGYTSNAIESAPQDLGAGQGQDVRPAAGVLGVDAVLRVEPWTSSGMRPLGELRSKGFSPLTEAALGYGYLVMAGRGGLELGRSDGTRGRLLYSFELMGLRGDQDQIEGGWAMEAHRGELEADLSDRLQAFTGVGRRIYRELPRTRTEWDGGLAAVLPLARGWNLTGIVAGRAHNARHSGWDAWGWTGLLRVRAPLVAGHMVKLRAMALWDRWPQHGEYDSEIPVRRDVVIKAQAGPWTRSLDGWRFGLTYNLSWRESLADDYDYVDHRLLLELRWQDAWDPFLPGALATSDDHLPLPYGFDRASDQGLDRVQDLLRQEDSARRGSSCVD